MQRARNREEQEYTREQRAELHRQLTVVEDQRDCLLNLRLLVRGQTADSRNRLFELVS